ncbi:MAG: hypothetical protein ACTIJY_07410 [Luteimonas sp.]
MQLIALGVGVGAIAGVFGVWMLGRRRSADGLPVDRHRTRKRDGAGSDIGSDGGGGDGGGGGD